MYATDSHNETLFNFYHNALLPLITLTFTIVAYGGKVWKRVVLLILLTGIKGVADRIAIALIGNARTQMVDSFYIDWRTDFVFILQYSTIFLLACIVLFASLIWVSRTIKMRRFNLSLLLFPLFLFGMFSIIGGTVDSAFYGTWMSVVGVAFSFISILALMFVLLGQDKKMVLEDELQEARHAMALEQAHYQEIEKRREALSKIRHDFNNQLASIGQLIQAGEGQMAQEMISAIAGEIAETKESLFCDIPVINAILLEKEQDCKDAGIGFDVDLKFPHSISVEPMHLCSIFGNLLDNAISACRPLVAAGEASSIFLSSLIDGDYLFI